MPRTRSVKWSELKLGIAVIVAVVLSAALIFAVGGQGGFFWQRYPLTTRFDDVAGLKPGAVVRLNGMEVGKVTRVELVEARVEVGFDVSRDVRPLITTDSRASMGTLSLLGEPIIDLTAARTGNPLPDGAFVESTGTGGVAGLANSAGQLMDDIRDGDVRSLLSSAARVAKHLEQGRGTLGALATDSAAYRSLVAALEDLAALTDRARAGEGPAGRLLNDDAMGRSLAETSASLEKITGAIARGDGSAGRLVNDPVLYERVAELTVRMDRVLSEIESGEGTAGRLLRDDALYENVSGATAELRALIADIRKDPKRFLSVDFSVF